MIAQILTSKDVTNLLDKCSWKVNTMLKSQTPNRSCTNPVSDGLTFKQPLFYMVRLTAVGHIGRGIKVYGK